jgi:hypothetical protein
MQQALRQIMQIKHRAETAISAILTRRRAAQETCIKVQSLVFCGIGLLILIVCGRSEHRHRLPPLKPPPPKNKFIAAAFQNFIRRKTVLGSSLTI